MQEKPAGAIDERLINGSGAGSRLAGRTVGEVAGAQDQDRPA